MLKPEKKFNKYVTFIWLLVIYFGQTLNNRFLNILLFMKYVKKIFLPSSKYSSNIFYTLETYWHDLFTIKMLSLKQIVDVDMPIQTN